MSEEQNNNKEEQKIKRGKNFDVFISYRRSDGTVKAKALDLAFSMDDCRTFLDFKSLGTGAFDKRLENAVLDAPIFIMVWTPDYFKRCVKEGEKTKNEDDWVRKEIELALANGKKIIPINYDEGMDKVPDYLDEEFKTKLGVHNVVNLHGDNTFDDTVKGIFDREIRPFIGATPKPENKVKVRVKADADCELISDDEVIATIQQGKTAQLFFEKGEYEITARSIAFPKIYDVIKRIFDDVSFNYFIKVELAERVLEYRDDIVGPGLRCAPPPKEDIKINEQKKRLEEERRRAEQARLVAERAEKERIEREKAEAERRERERRQREEEARRRKEERERRKEELKEWWERNKSKCVMLLAVIAGAVVGTWCIKNCEGATETATETAVETITEEQKEELFKQYVAKAEAFDLEYVSNPDKENLLDSVRHYYELALELEENSEIRNRLKGL
ncbi:MAG: toll/interleukin-1 receptor domain-containing protein [Bacteroidales bacterium]|nr:toll/interleukin-1 receptor domain-containing protein [Bacteroidales bacterium]